MSAVAAIRREGWGSVVPTSVGIADLRVLLETYCGASHSP